MAWTRDAIAARVDALAGRDDFVDAVRAFSEQLADGERELLGQVLLERAASLDYAWEERTRARGWLRRQWDRAARG